MNYKVNRQYQWILAIWLIAFIYLSTLAYIKLPFIGLHFGTHENTGVLNLIYKVLPQFKIETQVYNLQILTVWICGVIAGPIIGSISALIYLTCGVFGLPLFSGGGGFEYIQEPTFGYLFSLPIVAYLSGKLHSSGKKILSVFLPIVSAHLIGILFLILFQQNYIDIAWHLSFSTIGYDLILAFILSPFLEVIGFVINEMFIQEIPNFNTGQQR